MSRTTLTLTIVALAMCCSTPAAAQNAGDAPVLEQWTPTADIYDLVRAWRKKPPRESEPSDRHVAITLVPIIASKPSTGLRFGVGANIDLALGDPANTRISSLTTGATISTRKQAGVFLTPSLYGRENRWRLDGDNHFAAKQLDNIQLGTGSEEDQLIDFDSTRFIESYSFLVRPNLYVGAGIVFNRQSDIRPADSADWNGSSFVTYSAQHGFELERQTSAGPSVSLTFDNRDNQNDAWRGWFASAVYAAHYRDFLGGDSNWQRLSIDLRKYTPLAETRRHELAFWVYGDFVTSGAAPYYALPATGSDLKGRSGRGYTEGRFRGERLLSGETEYRASLLSSGVLGFVGFINAATISNRDAQQSLFESWEIGGGAGLRLLLHKRSRTNVCLDFGVGRGSHGIYLGLTDAF